MADGHLDKIDKESSPRLISSHLPAHLLPVGLWSYSYVYLAEVLHLLRTIRKKDQQEGSCLSVDLIRKSAFYACPVLMVDTILNQEKTTEEYIIKYGRFSRFS